MSTQPTALILADWLEDQYDPTHNQEDAAAELRRLHALNGELLAALKEVGPILARMYGPQAETLPPMQRVRAAIAKAEGEV
jgi:hypothetical protein